jgi:hypothetical protein
LEIDEKGFEKNGSVGVPSEDAQRAKAPEGFPSGIGFHQCFLRRVGVIPRGGEA